MVGSIYDALLYFKTEMPKQPRSVESWDKKEAYEWAIKGLKVLEKQEGQKDGK